LIRASICSLVLAAATAVSAVASADDQGSSAYFHEGQRLMKAGNYREACPQFEKALALNPGAGTKFNLADCYEKTERPASALALFREVEAVTRQVAQTERSAAAKERADSLEARVPTLIVRAPWIERVPTATITLDGKALTLKDIETPIKVDLGKHLATARVDQKETRAEADVKAERTTATLALESPVELSAAASNAATTPSTTTATSSPPAEDPSRGRGQRIVGGIVAGVGLATTIVGSVVVLGAKGSYDEAKDACGGAPRCTNDQRADADNAASRADVGGVIFGAGLVFLAGGVVLYLTAPKATKTLGLAPAPNGFSLRGSF
jgi:hypothetical protein